MGGANPPTAVISLVYGGAESDLTAPLQDCDTGIEQMFMIATAILTAKNPKLFLIDEPHAFLHPAAERYLLRLMQEHLEHQYVVATHSPVFLNSLPLHSTRLITISGAGSQINSVQEATEILESGGNTRICRNYRSGSVVCR
jgi:predicted ATPase